MPEMTDVSVKNLSIDLNNYRTIPQKDEPSAIEAMVSASPDRFWALADSLLTDGYLPTENVIVLRTGARKLTVKEGNRRVAALKLIHGAVAIDSALVPDEVTDRIAQLASEWRAANSEVPCTIYDATDAAIVDRIVTLAHGKGEKAGRDQWNAVARARHNRDANGAGEPALDLLEKYLATAKNVTAAQAARWSGDYPLTVLEEAMKRIAPRLALPTFPALAAAYPNIAHRDSVDKILHDIGLRQLGFDDIRRKETDFAVNYGIPAAAQSTAAGAASGTQPPGSSATASTSGGSPGATSAAKAKAVAINDPRAVTRTLKAFSPRGKNREKVVLLKSEAARLKIDKTPMAFCFVLRSMFEISARAYAEDHKSTGGPTVKKPNGDDKTLAELLRDITKHLTNNKKDKVKTKILHGAIAELASCDGFLSVTSMNQLVHSPSFSISPTHLATLFANVFPLLEEMNS